jgi:hypothetical protein
MGLEIGLDILWIVFFILCNCMIYYFCDRVIYHILIKWVSLIMSSILKGISSAFLVTLDVICCFWVGNNVVHIQVMLRDQISWHQLQNLLVITGAPKDACILFVTKYSNIHVREISYILYASYRTRMSLKQWNNFLC